MKTARKGSAPRGDPGAIVTVSPRDYDAVLFDLDGVLTHTASVHAAAWKKLFDAFLEARAAEMGEPFVPFDIDADYRRYVDGKPRYDGVAAFLAARSIELPAGTPEDGPGLQTVHALGNLKDEYFMEHLQRGTASTAMRTRSRSCRRSARRTSGPPSSPRATTARRSSKQPAPRSSSTRAWTGGTSALG
jgi:beta-phosphoglucomutase-like phosphatase (HAD superfamily)